MNEFIAVIHHYSYRLLLNNNSTITTAIACCSVSRCTAIMTNYHYLENVANSVRVTAIQESVQITSDFWEVGLSCDMAGYIHPDEDFTWYRDNKQLTGSRYVLEYRNGSQTAQNGGSQTVPSRVSRLRITQLNHSDAGNYTCRVEGTSAMAEITFSIVTPQGKQIMIAIILYVDWVL